MSAFFTPSVSAPMSCAQAEELLLLRLYDEVPQPVANALEMHLEACENCRRESSALRALQETLAQAPPQEPAAELLAASRRQLASALNAEASRRTPLHLRLFQSIFSGFNAFGTTPFAAAAMLVCGLGLGTFGGYRLGVQAHSLEPVRTVVLESPQNSPVAEVSSVVPQPDGRGVVVGYNRLVPESTSGSVDDPAIRQLLAMGIQNPTEPAVQDASVNLLAEACIHGAECGDSLIRSALMSAARYDSDATLRGKALVGLEPYIAEDTSVRDTVLDRIEHDRSAQVREQAIRMLSPIEADTRVQQVLHNASTTDRDAQVRRESGSMFKDASDLDMQIQ